MRKISRIEPTVPSVAAKKKVAAYARISMESERMHHSLSAQISYYNALIQKKPEWEFAGVYADDGISGTGIAKRSEFQRMVADCEAGKIDIVLTKSIQRFARNTVDLLETVRHLKDIGVEVRFEKENISSMSGDGELMLSILASFAQEESRSISENVKWGTRKRFEQGIPNGKFQIYGYRWEDDHLVVEPEEAVVVKRIFQNFLDGKSRLETERELEADGIRTRQGCVMRDSNLKQILSNVTYTGNMLLQKEYISDPINKQRRKNHGELPQYWVENTHEAIIDIETFRYIQQEVARRKEQGPLANKSLNTSCFTGKIKCPYYNQSYMHNTRKPRTPNGNRLEFWVCGSRKIKGGNCPVGGSINQVNMKKVLADVLGTETFDESTFLEKVDVIYVTQRCVLEIHLADGQVITRDCKNTGHQDCWTAEYREKTSEKRRKKPNCKGSSAITGKLKCVICGCNFRRMTQPSATMESGKAFYWRCGERNGCGTVGLREDVLKPFIAETLGIPQFDDAEFERQIDHIDVLSASEMLFYFKDGSTIKRTWVPPKRVGKPWTEERRAKFIESSKHRVITPEQRKVMSERMRALRKERGDKWKKEK